jgi:hypothetical protein
MTVSPLSRHLVADLLHPIGESTGTGILAVEQREEALGYNCPEVSGYPSLASPSGRHASCPARCSALGQLLPYGQELASSGVLCHPSGDARPYGADRYLTTFHSGTFCPVAWVASKVSFTLPPIGTSPGA